MTRIGAIRVAIIQSYKAASDFPAPRRFGGKHTSTLALAGGVRLSTIAHQNRPPCGLRVTRQEREYLTKWQFGNQINPDHVIPTLTETYGNWGTRRSPLWKRPEARNFMGLRHSSEPLPSGNQVGGLRILAGSWSWNR